MKRTILAAILIIPCVLPASPALAQLGLYGEFGTTHDSSIDGWYKGFTGGAYGNLLNAGPLHLGLDFRGSFQTGNQYRYRSFVAGPRLELKLPVLPIRPYIQAAVGTGGTRYTGLSPLTTHYSNKLQYGLIGGLDLTVLPHVDLRIPEIGYLRMSGVSGGFPAPKVSLVNLGFGLVVRLP